MNQTKSKKRILAFVLTFMMVFTMLPTAFLAVPEYSDTYHESYTSEAAYAPIAPALEDEAVPLSGDIATRAFPIAEGQFPEGGGVNGAPWRLYHTGELVVDSGFVHQMHPFVPQDRPWHQHRELIEKIIFTGPIIAGSNMRGFFAGLWNLSVIEGLEYFDTSGTTDMSVMFDITSRLSSVDLSSWDTSNVTNMGSMFEGSGVRNVNLGGNFNTSSVTNMSFMFYHASHLESVEGISSWNTSNVREMQLMFSGIDRLTSLDLSNWDTRNVINMGGMLSVNGLRQLTLGENFVFVTHPEWGNALLRNASGANGSHWVQGTRAYTGAEMMANTPTPITGTWTWGYPAATDLCPTCGQVVCLANVTGQFTGANGAEWRLYTGLTGANAHLNGRLYVEPGTVHGGFLTPGPGLRHGVSPWNEHRSNITSITFRGPAVAEANMSHFFFALGNVINGLSYLDTSATTNMHEMFAYSSFVSLDLTNLNTSQVTSMHAMFDSASSLTSIAGITNWDTREVRSMGLMFCGTGLTSLDLSGWNTSNVTNMDSMFWNSDRLTSLDLSGWDTRNVTQMGFMFYGTWRLGILDLSSFDTRHMGPWSMDQMFSYAGVGELTLGQYFRFPNSAGCDVGLFDAPTHRWMNVGTQTVANPQANRVYTGAEMMANPAPNLADTWVVRPFTPTVCPTCGHVECVAAYTGTISGGAPWRLYTGLTGADAHLNGRLYVEAGTASSTSSSSAWWVNGDVTVPFHQVTHIIFRDTITAGANLSNLFDTFWGMWNLTSIEGLSNFNTIATTNMSNMFLGPNQITTLDVSGWNTSNVTNMSGMFAGMEQLTSIVGINNWNTGNVQNMSAMFMQTTVLPTVDVSNWDVSSVTNTNGMFGLTGITSLDLSRWNTISLTNMIQMFSDSENLTSIGDVSEWNTSNVTNMVGVFSNTAFTNLDLSGWDTSNVDMMSGMFSMASVLTSIDLTGFDTRGVAEMNNMFFGTPSLRELTLGANFMFIDDPWGGPRLPAAPTTAPYTGNWTDGTRAYTAAVLMTNPTPNVAGTWVWQTAANTGIVRFHFDGGHTDVTVTLGEVVPLASRPIPATRYGSIGNPGQAFMGWYTQAQFNNMHYLNYANRVTVLNLNTTTIEAGMLDNGIFHLHGSWLRYGNVLGRGIETTMPTMMDHGVLHARVLGMITDADLLPITADVNVDGRVDMADHGLLHMFALGMPVILGVPAP